VGHSVNANIAMVSAFSVHPDRDEAMRRGQEGFDFFYYAINALVAEDARPGRSRLWDSFQATRPRPSPQAAATPVQASFGGSGIGTPDDMRLHLRGFEEAGVDQVIFLQQAGHNRHEHICASLELFGAEVLEEFHSRAEVREARKREELAPWIASALARRPSRAVLEDSEIPVVEASRARAEVNQTSER
jgi:hypothetical protein